MNAKICYYCCKGLKWTNGKPTNPNMHKKKIIKEDQQSESDLRTELILLDPNLQHRRSEQIQVVRNGALSTCVISSVASNMLQYVKIYLPYLAPFKTNVTKFFTSKSRQTIKSIRTETKRHPQSTGFLTARLEASMDTTFQGYVGTEPRNSADPSL